MKLGTNYWRLFASSGTSNLADGVTLIALPLLAASITRDPVQISALQAAAYLPWLVFAVPGGAIVDRIDRQHAMVVGNLARVTALFILANLVVVDAVSIWLLYAVVLALGFIEVVYDSASRAMLPQVVGRDQLDRGNSYLSMVETVGQQFVGAPLGAFLFAAAAALPLFGASLGYLVAAVLMMLLSGSFRFERTVTTTLRADVREGMGWLWRHTFLRGLTMSSGVFGFFQAMVNGVMVLYALETLDLSEREFGLLIVAAAVGGLGGGLLAPRVSDLLGRGVALVGAALLSPVCLVGMGLTTTPWVAGVLFAASSAAVTIWNVLSMSIRQALIPGELFGRVLGTYRMVIWGVIPLGALTGGALASASSLGDVFIAAGLGQLAAAGWIWALMARHRTEISDAYREFDESSTR